MDVFPYPSQKRTAKKLCRKIEKLKGGVYGQPSIFWMKNPSFSIACAIGSAAPCE